MSKRKKSNSGRQGRSSAASGQSKDGQGGGQEKAKRRWYRVDLHLHSPASSDYEEPKVTYLEWLRTASERDLDIVAITDHNTVAGVGAVRREIEWLTRLETAGRLTDEERERLNEWRELSEKVLVLPGFEFTATFGFHILGIFPPETPVRQLEHVLLSLNVPVDKLDEGSTETGSATDVLTAYRVIHEAGGLAIAAHANASHGVAMRNFAFGGQTKIAYTQDPNLDALEVTDLEKRYRSTARFFNGSKNEYPRRMHCIQGSDAHRLTNNPKNPRRLGIGERATEMLLDDLSFNAVRTVLRSKQFDRTRPARPADMPFDAVASAREEGPTLVQSFHESASQRGGRLTTILNDICAFANTSGGTVFVGVGQRKGKPKGLSDPTQVQTQIEEALSSRLTPPLKPTIEVIESEGAKILKVETAKGADRPYCLDDHKFYVRDESDTSLAVRDEVVALVLEAQKDESEPSQKSSRSRGRRRRRGKSNGSGKQTNGDSGDQDATASNLGSSNGSGADEKDAFYLPQVGVEIVATEERDGNRFHTICDLRNGHVIKNVTRKGARKLWNYAIQQVEDNPIDAKQVTWQGDVGMVRSEKRAGKERYDLALREGKEIRVFYGVTEDGMDGPWGVFVQDD